MSLPKGAATILAESDYKGHLVVNETNPVAAIGSTNILGGDPERTIMLVYNLSASEIFVGFGVGVSSSNGILLPPSGGFVGINAKDDYAVVNLPLYAYSAAGGNQLYILTMRRETAYIQE